MKYKTYKKRPTKQKARENKIILMSFISLVLLAGILDAIFGGKIIKEVFLAEQPKEEINIEIVELISKNYQQEIDLRLAVEQACKYVNAEKWGLQDQCELDLIAMAHTETQEDPFNCQLVGDGGKSKGCFQIHQGYHSHITDEQAQDPYWASIWTIKRLISKGYPEYRSNAIMAHNGTPGITATLKYLEKVNKLALK